MNLKLRQPLLTRPLCVLDIESATARERPDPAVDRIISLAMQVIMPDGFRNLHEHLFNPCIPITPENAAVHGYTNDVVSGFQPLSKALAQYIKETITGCDLAGFNAISYDIPLLWEECYRVGVELDFTGIHFIDAGIIMKKKEQRSLTAAVKLYCGYDHEGAHGAAEDVQATIDVLEAQLIGTKYVLNPLWHGDSGQNDGLAKVSDSDYTDLQGMDIPALAEYCKQDSNGKVVNRVDLFGTIVLNYAGVPVFNTRRNYGVPVKQELGYAEWILRNDFPQNTKRCIEKILDGETTPTK